MDEDSPLQRGIVQKPNYLGLLERGKRPQDRLNPQSELVCDVTSAHWQNDLPRLERRASISRRNSAICSVAVRPRRELAGANPLKARPHDPGWQARSGQLKRGQKNESRSRLHRQVNGRGCTSRFYRYGSSNPVESASGNEHRPWPYTRENLYRLVLQASQVSDSRTQDWSS